MVVYGFYPGAAVEEEVADVGGGSEVRALEVDAV